MNILRLEFQDAMLPPLPFFMMDAEALNIVVANTLRNIGLGQNSTINFLAGSPKPHSTRMERHMPKLHPAQFQFVVTARVKKGTRPSREEVREVVEHWIEGTASNHADWTVRVIIWDGSKERMVNEIDGSPRGEVLRSILRRGLPQAKFRIVKVGRG